MTGVIVAKGMATLKELQTYYNYGDALDMIEIIRVTNYNEWAYLEEDKLNR